ncbi:hypothetical protein [Methyloglobulus sp.]|uniref:hypothetical protein n=1 Tax=Methyloglobulus sp. TaxID=2518622 RepID=UPI0032B82063
MAGLLAPKILSAIIASLTGCLFPAKNNHHNPPNNRNLTNKARAISQPKTAPRPAVFLKHKEKTLLIVNIPLHCVSYPALNGANAQNWHDVYGLWVERRAIGFVHNVSMKSYRFGLVKF